MVDVMPTIPPRPTDISKPFWDGCRDHRLLMQQCQDCRTVTFYPVYMCPSCASERLEWVELSGRGHVHSVTTVHRPSAPAFAPAVPYVLALIEVAEGPIMMSNIVGPDALSTQIGDEVAVVFEDVGEVTLPRFRRVGA
ncbi:Zn-ribbon domain-containing OB-fold protein [Rhodoligotrophos ferricapiens]|uniref:Zn-ribbon domain-containing OB-fold protein n=1 Tax=Rhodoligotrophos ferricapiens TaxID=3069264 RepID=UPI00315D26B9